MKEIQITKCKAGSVYKICRFEIEDKNLLSQLGNLGIVKGKNIEVRLSNYGKKSFLVSVMGINYALDKLICERIWVYDK